MPNRKWSTLTLVTETIMLTEEDVFSNLGVVVMAMLIFCFTILAPAVQLVCQAVLWGVKLTSSTRQYLEMTLEVSTLWCGLDVFLLATALVMEELGPLTAYFGHEFVKQLRVEQVVPCENNDCFSIQLHREIGWHFVLGHVLLSYTFTWCWVHVKATTDRDDILEVDATSAVAEETVDEGAGLLAKPIASFHEPV